MTKKKTAKLKFKDQEINLDDVKSVEFSKPWDNGYHRVKMKNKEMFLFEFNDHKDFTMFKTTIMTHISELKK